MGSKRVGHNWVTFTWTWTQDKSFPLYTENRGCHVQSAVRSWGGGGWCSFEAPSINWSVSDDLVLQLTDPFSSLQLSSWAFPAEPSLRSLLWPAPRVFSVPCGGVSFRGAPSRPRIAGGPGLCGLASAAECPTLCSQYALCCCCPGNYLCICPLIPDGCPLG